jgi:hypothetical protein
MDLGSLAVALDTVLAGLPFIVAEELDPVLSTSKMSGPLARR